MAVRKTGKDHALRMIAPTILIPFCAQLYCQGTEEKRLNGTRMNVERINTDEKKDLYNFHPSNKKCEMRPEPTRVQGCPALCVVQGGMRNMSASL